VQRRRIVQLDDEPSLPVHARTVPPVWAVGPGVSPDRGRSEAARIEPGGVAETLLSLYHRAAEARRPDGVLDDPRAVRLVDGIDFPFGQRFGAAAGAWSQWQALRARAFDGAVRRFLAAHPDGTVVALGEGLETTYWRVDNGRVRWLSVDLPEALELRTRLLPREQRQRWSPRPRRTSAGSTWSTRRPGRWSPPRGC
jgi:hypothetical protein